MPFPFSYSISCSSFLAYIDPFQGMGTFFQLVKGQLHCAVSAACRGIHRIKPLQGNIQIYRHIRLDHKGTDASRRMSHPRFHLIPRDHFCFLVKKTFIFLIVHFPVTGCHNQHWMPLPLPPRWRWTGQIPSPGLPVPSLQNTVLHSQKTSSMAPSLSSLQFIIRHGSLWDGILHAPEHVRSATCALFQRPPW